MSKDKNIGGRPPFYNNVVELQDAIDDYFKNGIKVKTVVVGSGKNTSTVEIEVPTITGLALHLGFCDRSSFYDYEKNKEFSYTIKRARFFIEQHYEELLQSGNVTGAIFALKNFGWVDRTESNIELSGKDIGFSIKNIYKDTDEAEEA